MSEEKKYDGKTAMEWHEASMRNWRAWGSWFSWGSPVGLGLFLVSIAGSLWILSQAFGWK
jgi:hypothetical protein